jgi:hypothetical protein
MLEKLIFVSMNQRRKSNSFPLRGLGQIQPELQKIAQNNFISINSLILQVLNNYVKQEKKKKVA